MGVSEQQILDLDQYATSGAFTDLERAVIRYAHGISATPVDVSDALFAELRGHLTEPQIVELTSAIAWENYRARFNRALRVPSQGFAEGSSCPLPIQ